MQNRDLRYAKHACWLRTRVSRKAIVSVGSFCKSLLGVEPRGWKSVTLTLGMLASLGRFNANMIEQDSRLRSN